MQAEAQSLRPGFDKREYKNLLLISAQQSQDSIFLSGYPLPEDYTMVYRSPETGLDNKWDLWINAAGTRAVISIRGTTAASVSWLENFYAAMVPAAGTISLRQDAESTVTYQLSQHPEAAVHVGWLIGMLSLSPTILNAIDSCYESGIQDFFIMGHSQGGAIAFLLTSHLRNLQEQGKLPYDIRFKTYCSAAPKPGNLYYAYDYEQTTFGGWSFTVINSADWVPEVPISIQTLDDFNPVNPFVHADKMIQAQSFPANMAMRHAFNQLDKPTRKARKKYQRYLGDLASTFVAKNLEGYSTPEYYISSNYVRTGTPVVLYADESYFTLFPENPENVFVHHFMDAYLHLLEQLPE